MLPAAVLTVRRSAPGEPTIGRASAADAVTRPSSTEAARSVCRRRGTRGMLRGSAWVAADSSLAAGSVVQAATLPVVASPPAPKRSRTRVAVVTLCLAAIVLGAWIGTGIGQRRAERRANRAAAVAAARAEAEGR